MNKKEFLQALKNTFHNAKVEDIDSIMDVYEEHFILGYEQGLRDQEIIKALGSPQEIYASYVEEGIIMETPSEGKGVQINMQAIYSQLEEYKAKIVPHIPSMAKQASKTIMTASSVLAFIIGVLSWILTPAALYLLSISWQPFDTVMPLPTISPVTLGGVLGTGFFSGLTSILIGVEVMKLKHHTFGK